LRGFRIACKRTAMVLRGGGPGERVDETPMEKRSARPWKETTHCRTERVKKENLSRYDGLIALSEPPNRSHFLTILPFRNRLQ
jgi:hypothetical protein